MEKETEYQIIESYTPKSSGFLTFAKKNAFVFWLIVLAASISVAAVFILPEATKNSLRGLAGLLLTLWLPGYSLVKALFPQKSLRLKTPISSGWLLTVAFSIVFSIISVALVGLALDFTPWGVGLNSLALGLFSLTICFSTVALVKSYRYKTFANKAEPHVE